MRNGVSNLLQFDQMRRNIFLNQAAYYAKKAKLIPNVDVDIQKGIEDGNFTAKKHPGNIRVGTVTMPEKLVDAIRAVLTDYPMKPLVADGRTLYNYLKSRHIPPSEVDIAEKTFQARREIEAKFDQNTVGMSDEEINFHKRKLSELTNRLVYQRSYHWHAIEFTRYVGLQYLFYRSPAEYAALYKIFTEISIRLPDFNPVSLFDFGSGVCTVTWAVKSVWKNSLKEFFYVDSSAEMNDLGRQLLAGGETENAELEGVNFRQFLPALSTLKYDIVVSSYSLFELPSLESRLKHLLTLWAKVADFLVIVENGSKSGFKLVTEARDLILKYEAEQEYSVGVHVFSPCPHEFDCPRLKTNLPCGFKVPYYALPFGRRSPVLMETYSYVVLKKGKRDPTDPLWPRVIEPVLKRSRRAICRVCTRHGDLKEMLFSKGQHGTKTYHIGRSVKWGDRLPVDLTEHVVWDELNENDEEYVYEDDDIGDVYESYIEESDTFKKK